MFLRPHHFQAADRRLREEIGLAEGWNVGYAYGLRRIEIDEEALVNYRLALRACQIRLHDGTHVRYPEDANLDAITLPKEAFEKQGRVMAYLGVPTLQMGRGNVGERGSNFRYALETVETEDENRGDGAQMLDYQWPNARLFLSGQDASGYETLPIVRLRRGAVAEAPPEVDREYIPPILACDAWPHLQKDLLGGIADRIGGSVDILAAQMIDRGVAFESGHREDMERIFKLHALNAALGYLWNISSVRGVHPLVAYMELCRVVGQLAIFRTERRMPQVPAYDHDDLGTCFYAVRRLIEEGLGGGAPAEYKKRQFVGAGRQMQVRMEREWLSPTWRFFIGVNSKLSFDQCVTLLRGLDLKVGSAQEVETIYLQAMQGISLEPQAEAPRLFPGKNWTYWKVDRQSNAWRDVQDSLTLAIRMNDRHFVGRIDNRQEIQIRTDDAREITLAFVLYAIPVEHL